MCFDTSAAEDLGSLSFVEKYCRYIQSDNISDIDSDCDFNLDDTILREEYAQLTSNAANHRRAKINRLSTGLPGRFRTISSANCKKINDEETIDVENNGTSTMDNNETLCGGDTGTAALKKDLEQYEELIKRLAEVRRTGPEGNSIFCTQEEHEAIQMRYAAILDFLQEKACNFDRKCSSKDYDNDNDEQVDVGEADTPKQREGMRLLQEKISSVKQARDQLNEVRNQMKEQIEQLEIFERTKMENVG